MLKANLFIVIFSVFAITSCDRNGVYEENINTSNSIWAENSVAKFIAPIIDTVDYHNIYINIRNTTNYPNCNLYLFIAITSPVGTTQLDTVEFFLADDLGKWLGKGFGYIRDNQIPYKRNIRFPLKGSYKFEIRQAMRTDSLSGIYSVGIRVEKSNVK